MSKGNGKKPVTKEEIVATIRPFQLEWNLIAHVEEDGQISRLDGAKGIIMEKDFRNGMTIANLVEQAKMQMEQKAKGG